jgi:hypothetical protein
MENLIFSSFETFFDYLTKKGIYISEPSKGKKVSQAEFEAIMDKKMKEQAEQFENNRGRDDGNSIEIRIEGFFFKTLNFL